MPSSPATASSSNQPRLNWLELLGGSADDTGFVVASGPDGAIYLGGETNGGAWDGASPRGRRDGFVARFNLAGQRLWTQWYGSSLDDQVRGLGVDPSGALYVSGGALDGVEGNPGLSPGASDGFLSRISIDGRKQWTTQLGAESWDLLRSLATGPGDGAVYGIGYSASRSFSKLMPKPQNEEGPDAFLIKADASGHVLWASRIGSGKQDYGMNLALGIDGFVYATGFSGNSTADSPADAFLSKLNARDGSLVWTRFLGTSVNDYGEDLCIDKDGFIYVLISTDGNLAGQPYQGNRDVGVQKFDRDGKLIWTVVLGTPQKEEGRNLICGPDGSLYLTGLTAGDLGGQKNSGGEDAFVCRISPDGVIAWTRLFGTAADDVGWALSLAANNSLIVSGLTNGNLEGRSSRGGQDAFIASLDLSEPLAPASVSVSLTGAQAREQGGPPLIYNVTRTGSLQDPLTIYYRLARTASQADYNGATASALNNLRLPAGVRSAELVLTPVADAQREGDESILLSLDPGPGYTIATPQTLQATILGDGNHLPIATAQVRLSLRVGGPTLSGRLTAADPDPGDRSAFTLLSAAPAGFALDESGAWSFNPADPQHLTLPAGQRRSTTLFYRVEDRVSQIQPPLPAGVIRVGGADGQFSTIQAALDQAPAGSVIVVAAGSYSENLIIRKPVTLLGAFQGIAAQDPARGKAGKETEIRGYVTVSASATDVTIDGVTLIGDPDRGVNMRVQAESSRLLNSIITAVRPAGGYADFAFVRFARDPGSPSGLSSVVAANNVFNGNVDYSSTPVVLQINRSASVRVQANSFLNCGGGGNIVLADDSGDISVSDNLLIGGGKGIATYNGTFARLTIENNTILDSNLTGIDINENSVIQAGGIEGNRVSGSGINRTQRTDVSPANLSVSELATLWDGFRIGDNDLSQTFAQIPAYQGFVPTGSTTATNRPSSIGALTIDLQAPVPTAASPAIPLARASDAARFRISRFASGLGFPSSMAELEDGSLLTAVTLGDPANRSPFGSTPSQLLRLVDANRDGSSDTVQVLATLPGFVTSLRRVGDLIFALSSGRQGTSPSISIFRTGATASAPLREVGVLQFQFPPDYLTAVNAHTSYALAARASATLPDGLELFFNLGPLEEDRSTDPSLTIGLAAFGDLALAPARMAPDSIQRLLISDRGDRLLISPPETVASGVRNAAGISFDRAGNLIFEDNGFSKPANGENTFSADELNRVNGDEIGRSVPDFGFGESFVRYSDGVIVNPSPDYRPPLVSFLPLAGRKSEGAVEVSMAPSGFPTEFINTVLTSFFGRFGVGTSLNDENPIVAADPESGTYYHFIGSGLLGNPGGLLAAGGSLYVADFSSTGLFFGSNGNTPADQAGAIYQISPIQPASFLSLPTLLDADASSATLTWTTDSDAFSTLELWGGPILEQAPRLYTLTPQRTGSQFSSRISLRDLLPGTVYSYRVRLGDQTSQASFSTAAAPLPRIELSLQGTAVREDGPAGLLYAVSRSGDSSAPLEVRVLLGGTANPSSDYDLAGAFNLAGSGASLRFAAGSSRATLLVDPRPDQQPEADETVAVSLAAGEGYAIASAAPVVGTILNDDCRVALSLADPSVAEDSGAPLRWTVSRSGDLSVPLTVRFRVTGSATPASGGADGDYGFSGPVSLRDGIGSLSLPAGVASAGFSLTPRADSTVEEDETISLRLLPTGYALAYGGPLTATIRNDDHVYTPGPFNRNGLSLGSTDLGYALRNGTAPPIQIRFADQFASPTNPGGGWQAVAAVAAGNGYQLYWRNSDSQRVSRWTLDGSGLRLREEVPGEAELLNAEADLATDLDDNGIIGSAETGTILRSLTVNASLATKGETDTYRISVPAGTILSAFLSSANGSFYPLIELRNPEGALLKGSIAYDNASADLGQFDLITGQAVLRVRTQIGATGPYSLTIGLRSREELKSEVIRLTNLERQKAGLAPLIRNSLLEQAADSHVQDMDRSNRYLAHTGSDGSTPVDRIRATGYKAGWVDLGNGMLRTISSENAASGQVSAAEVVQAWMNSKGHRDAILDPATREIGVGYEFDNEVGDIPGQSYKIGTSYWIQNFGHPWAPGLQVWF